MGVVIGILFCYWAMQGKIIHTPLPSTTKAIITEYSGDRPTKDTPYFRHEGDVLPIVSFKSHRSTNGSLSYSALYRA